MFKFYFVLLGELLLLPILYLKEFLKRYISIPERADKKRQTANYNKLVVGIHDWAGYELKRTKTINNISFDCGLKFQLDRFANYKGTKDIKLSLTISGEPDNNYDKYNGLNITKVSNYGMDFRGYSQTIQNESDQENCYVLLMNSSVEAKQVDFIDQYIEFLENNPTVGLLGISYSSKIFQTLIRNNFTPHIQSFFLITTLNVLKEVISHNKGEFPGQDIIHKRLLIRFGEVRLSRIISDLGYQLAVITDQGKPFIFPKTKGLLNTAYQQWKQPKGEYRFHTKHPNRINAIT